MIRFYTECAEKETEMRSKWFLRNQKKLERMAELPEKYRDIRTAEVMKLPVEMCLPSLTTHHESNRVNRLKKPLRDGIIQVSGKDSDSGLAALEPIMKAVDPDVQKILFQDPPLAGRRVYLTQREHLKPEDRYYECMTQNTAYGWRVQERKPVKSLYARRFVFKHDLVSRRAPHVPDPEYYSEPI